MQNSMSTTGKKRPSSQPPALRRDKVNLLQFNAKDVEMQKKIQAHMVDYQHHNIKQSATMADSNFQQSQSNFTKKGGFISQSPRNSEDEVQSPSTQNDG